jgi:hypothetical protein
MEQYCSKKEKTTKKENKDGRISDNAPLSTALGNSWRRYLKIDHNHILPFKHNQAQGKLRSFVAFQISPNTVIATTIHFPVLNTSLHLRYFAFKN